VEWPGSGIDFLEKNEHRHPPAVAEAAGILLSLRPTATDGLIGGEAPLRHRLAGPGKTLCCSTAQQPITTFLFSIAA
jgi:hypothetical protein